MSDELETMLNATEGTMETAEPKKKKGGRAPKEGAEKKKKEPKPKRDNIARVAAMTSIGDVRKALQIAIAKKAKANDKVETQARYDLEITAAKEKLAELLTDAQDTASLLALGEEPNRVITHFIADSESAFEAWLTEKEYKVSKKTLKNISDDIPTGFYTALPPVLHDTLVSRHAKSDYRLRAVCKAYNFKSSVMNGDFVWENNKWIDKNAVVPAEATEATEAAE